jgi:hypothetical protein
VTPCNSKVGWRYWLAMDALLAIGLSGLEPLALHACVALGGAQSIHYLFRERRLMAFPVQVRLAYFGLLMVGYWNPVAFVHWIQLVGTTALLVFDYCPLARLLSLAPWNRRHPLTPTLVWRTFVSPPVPGSILQGAPGTSKHPF